MNIKRTAITSLFAGLALLSGFTAVTAASILTASPDKTCSAAIPDPETLARLTALNADSIAAYSSTDSCGEGCAVEAMVYVNYPPGNLEEAQAIHMVTEDFDCTDSQPPRTCSAVEAMVYTNYPPGNLEEAQAIHMATKSFDCTDSQTTGVCSASTFLAPSSWSPNNGFDLTGSAEYPAALSFSSCDESDSSSSTAGRSQRSCNAALTSALCVTPD